MKKHIFTLFLSVSILFGCGESNQNQGQKPQESDSLSTEGIAPTEGVIASETQKSALPPIYVLSDQFGEKFLLQDSFNENKASEAPESLNQYKYILYNGKYYPVTFKGPQLENEEENNYRDTYYNFDNLPGWLFTMDSGKLLETPKDEYDAIWGAPLLVDEAFHDQCIVLPTSNNKNNDAISKDLISLFEKKYGRNIMNSWLANSFGENNEYQLINVQFENKGNQALGVVAIVKDGQLLAVKNYPAEWNDMSVWRVDDEGEFGGLDLDFATIENGVLNLYTYDMGFEGTNYQNYFINADTLCKGNVSASYYQAPM